ncbi:MAG: cupin domain-containing protein [Candidatus Omnitrophica bacterium]|nr:cupin domain-containing protein [Candidatus Omnitrophota bacterium]
MQRDMVKKASVLRLAALVGYQKGAVVSKEIIRKDTGTVTVFSFDKGEGLSEHTAPFDALVYVLDGRAQIFISGKQYILTKGDLIIMPADKPHSLKAINKFKMLLVMIKEKGKA